MASQATARYCMVIPHFNHAQQLIQFLPSLIGTKLPIVIVDDGSDEGNIALLLEYKETSQEVHIFFHRVNRGKGAAVRSGLTHARAMGFTHVVQMDADGQHNVNDVSIFVQKSQENPNAIICGRPYFDQAAPKLRVYGRRITDFWVCLETLSAKVKDSLCGFRVYPLTQVEHILDAYYCGPRMDFDPELLVKSVWANTELIFIPTYVKYPAQNVSHFNYLRDNGILISLHVRLMLGMICRLPLLLIQILRGRK